MYIYCDLEARTLDDVKPRSINTYDASYYKDVEYRMVIRGRHHRDEDPDSNDFDVVVGTWFKREATGRRFLHFAGVSFAYDQEDKNITISNCIIKI